MYKRGDFFLLGFLLIMVFLAGVISAQETDIISGLEEEYPDAELGVDAGIGPDDFFYFMDNFFDRFGDNLKVREEKIAEIRDMIREGKIEEARKALRRYRKLANELEREIDPERRDEARRSAAAIRRALNALASEMPPEIRGEFIDNILEREGAIVTSVEIANRIKDLCETLSELDPLEYSRVCKTDEDSPDWYKRLDKKWTEEQRKEARKFAEIMSDCFRTSGQDCACDEIPFTAFAETCSIAAPLATACDIEGDEEACEKLDDLEMPELPPHLQEVFDRLEENIRDDQYDMHMPKECVEAGVTSPRECGKIMITVHAPEECKEALLEADVGSEKEGREICERILMKINAPECAEEGITDPEECGILMFELNAPQECLDAGLTGEHRSDGEKCRVIMEGGGVGPDGFGPPALGIRCRKIQNPEERLRCYDSALGSAQGAYIEARGEPPGGWPEPCLKENTLTRESCERTMIEWGEIEREKDRQKREQHEEPEVCIEVYEPVCGVDENTYSNSCFAGLENVEIVCRGECPCETRTNDMNIGEGVDTTTESSNTTTDATTTDVSNTTTGTGLTIFTDNEFYRYYSR